MLYRNWHVGVAGHLIFGLLVAAFFWRVDGAPAICAWFGALAAAVGLRVLVLASFRRRVVPATLGAVKAASWLRRLLVIMALQGVVWGIAGPLLVPGTSLAQICVMVLALAAVSAGAAAALSAHFGVVAAFIVPALVPYGAVLTASALPGAQTLGIASLFFAASMLLYARAANRTLLHALRIQADNARLIDRLDEETLSIAALNRQLSADTNRREQIEVELRLAKEHAEHMADRLSLASALDGLTGLASSRHFEDVVKREWTRAARGGTPLAMITCEVDAFDGFCQRHGHGKGDELLRLIAHVLLLHARRVNDLVARTGEQRFALLIPLAETAQAAAVADQIRQAVQALAVEHGTSSIGETVTVSLGVASFIPEKGMSFKILEQTADNMLRSARASGHNRVCTYRPALA